MSQNRVMTEELRKQLAGYLPFSNEAVIGFTPQAFLLKDVKDKFRIPEQFHPIFSVRCFTKSEYEEAKKILHEELSDKDKKGESETFQKTRDLVRKVVTGFKNLWDIGTMMEISYKSDPAGGCDKALWDKIPDFIYYEIRNYVHQISGITPGELVSLK
jgi:hypothetical protein